MNLPTPEDVAREQENLNAAMDAIRNSPSMREKDIMAALQEFSSFSDEELVQKREELLNEMNKYGDKMSIMSHRGRQVNAIDQLLRSRGLK